MACRVGPYIVGDTLGEGRFGKVKIALHAEKGVQYAMKIIPKEDIRQASRMLNVRREIAIMKALNHRNIVNLREVLASRTKLYIVMELVDGEELFHLINREGELSPRQARAYFQQLVDGIDYCHRRGVYHRDLKPDNLLIDRSGTLKITDFGVSSVTNGLTGSELLFTACGTSYYCAPEVLNGAEDGYFGAKTDSWSIGIILYVLLTGTLPFMEDGTTSLLDQVNRCQVRYPRWVPADARDLIGHLLVRDPNLRYSLDDVKQHPFFLQDYEHVSMDGNHLFGSSSSLRTREIRNVQSMAALQDASQSQASMSVSSFSPGSKVSPPPLPPTPPPVPIEVRDLSSYNDESLLKLVSDALPGKSDKRVSAVVRKLTDLDIDDCEDLIFLASSLKQPNKFSNWLEEKSQLPSITCMRLASFFYTT